MQRRWKGKNVNLDLLTTHIADFFREKDFEAIKGNTETGHQILGGDSPYFRLQGYVSVTVEGKPEDFLIKLDLNVEKEDSFRLSPILLSMFGGGYFFLQKLKSDETWIKLEQELWRYIENAVLHLTGTAKL